MATHLKISVGQHSDRGRKESNQDFHGACLPKEPLLASKGVAVAIADGISGSDVSHIASQFAVTGFLEDYYCTSEAWSVKKSAERVLAATNSWLYSQTQRGQGRYDKDRGYVCTLSALVVKSNTAHLFHVGDTRIYRLQGKALEQLTNDHRVRVAPGESYLGRAFGIDGQVEIDYRTVAVEAGDVFVLATDGVYEHVDGEDIVSAINASSGDLDAVARAVVALAFERGSGDNLTAQLVRIEALPDPDANEIRRRYADLPFPPLLEARAQLDGYRIVRTLHGSSRSHIYLAIDGEGGSPVVIKAPSIDLRDDAVHIERFLMEEWVARRIDSAHVLKPREVTRERSCIYVVTEFIEGKTLAQWMIDHPKPRLDAVRGIAAQIGKGLRAFHRAEMLHRDLRPANIMIDTTGTVKIIDFGSTQVAGIVESGTAAEQHHLAGAAQYAAPEYFLGERGSVQSDIFSLGVIAYEMLCGRLPYGTEVPKCKSARDQKRLQYRSLLNERPDLPAWVDEAIRKAVHPDPRKRYDEAAEFIHDLHHPNPAFLGRKHVPLIERDPVVFWKGVSFLLMLLLLLSLALKSTAR